MDIHVERFLIPFLFNLVAFTGAARWNTLLKMTFENANCSPQVFADKKEKITTSNFQL